MNPKSGKRELRLLRKSRFMARKVFEKMLKIIKIGKKISGQSQGSTSGQLSPTILDHVSEKGARFY